MDEKNSGIGALLIGSGLALLILLAWLIFPYLLPRPTPVASVRASASAGVLSRSLELVPGAIVTTPEGKRQAQFLVSVAPDWKLTEFRVEEIFRRQASLEVPLRVSSAPPELPTRQSFTIEFDLPPVNPELDLWEIVKIDFKYRAVSGFLGSKKENGSRGLVFRVGDEALEEMKP